MAGLAVTTGPGRVIFRTQAAVGPARLAVTAVRGGTGVQLDHLPQSSGLRAGRLAARAGSHGSCSDLRARR